MNEKYYTITVKSNLFKPLYVDEFSRLTFNENEQVSFTENYKKRLSESIIVRFIKGQNKGGDELFKSDNIDDLKIEILENEVDLKDFPRKVTVYDGMILYAKEKTLRIKIEDKKREIQELKNQITEIESDIEQLENEKLDTESDIYGKEQELKELEAQND